MKNIPKTFGHINKIMSILTAIRAYWVDNIFDQYFSPSLKDYERTERHELRNWNYIKADSVDFAEKLHNTEFEKLLWNF